MAEKARTVNRRKVLQALGASSVIGLAGCEGNDGDDGGDDGGSGGSGGGGNGGELGERVPTVVIQPQTGLGASSAAQEAMMPAIQDAMEAVGLDTKVEPAEYLTQIGNQINDNRAADWYTLQHGISPDRLDPHGMLRRYGVDNAGANGRGNLGNIADCEYTTHAVNQATAPTVEERQKIVNDAINRWCEIYATIPVSKNNINSAYHTDQVEMPEFGAAGIPQLYQHKAAWEGKPIGKDTMLFNTDVTALKTRNFMTLNSSPAVTLWGQVVHSTLTSYDNDWKLINSLAEDYTVEDEGRTISVTLKDATAHNGDPITSEDIKFTFELLWNNTGAYPQSNSPEPFESIEIVDDKTAQFNFSEPFTPLITRVWPRWGILHKATWEAAGAVDNPSNPDFGDTFHGTGPYKIEGFEPNQSLRLSAHDGNPSPPNADKLTWVGHRSSQSAWNAFQAGELDVYTPMTPEHLAQAEEMDNVETVITEAFMPRIIYPDFPTAPTKFQAVRQAVGTALSRQMVNELAHRGIQENPPLNATPFLRSHPWNPETNENGENIELPKFTESPDGDVEAARQVLSDEGWGWNGDERLHYPPDADLSPLWPEGEVPTADEFPCMEELGLSASE